MEGFHKPLNEKDDRSGESLIDFRVIAEKMMDIIISTDDEQTILARMSEMIGTHLGVDRVLIVDVDIAGGLAKGLVEWVIPSCSHLPSALRIYPLELFPKSASYIQQEGNYILSHAHDPNPLLREEGSNDLMHGDLGIRSLLWYPIYYYDGGCYLLVLNQMISSNLLSLEELDSLSFLSKIIQMALQKIRYLQHIEQQSELYRQTAEQFEMLIESIPDAVFFKDGEGRWLVVNSVGQSLFELDGVDWEGKTDLELGEMRPHLKIAHDNCVADDNCAWSKGVLSMSEEILPDDEGGLRTFSVHKVPLFTPEGERKGLVTIGRDVTEYKQLNAKLQELNETLEARVLEETEKNRQKDRMLYEQSRKTALSSLLTNISHHWRQPLTILSMGLNNLVDTCQEGDMTKERMRSSVEHYLRVIHEMSETIDRFRTIAAFKEHSDVFDVGEAIRTIVELHEPLLSEMGIAIRCHCETSHFYHYGNESSFNQNIVALLENSMEAIKKTDSSEKMIMIAVRLQEEMIEIEIEDTGGGIRPEDLPRVFDPYFTTKEQGHGTGLRLFFIREFVEKNGGSITLANTANGLRCMITLPLNKA